MPHKTRVRPSQKPGFRLAAFAAALFIFALSYWLGNRYKNPDLPKLQALLLHPARPLPEFSLIREKRQAPFTALIDDWLLLFGGPIDKTRIRILAGAHNRLANDRKLQGRFRVWLLEATDQALPGFFQPQNLDPDALQQLYGSLNQVAGDHFLFLINPDGRLQAVFTGMESPATIATDFRAILNHYSP